MSLVFEFSGKETTHNTKAS